MLLGRRKSGFTEEQVLRPSEIPDYVNEENDTTFARPKSACMGHEAPAAPEPQAWIPPQPMPEYRLLREYIRSQCELHQITPRSQLPEHRGAAGADRPRSGVRGHYGPGGPEGYVLLQLAGHVQFLCVGDDAGHGG